MLCAMEWNVCHSTVAFSAGRVCQQLLLTCRLAIKHAPNPAMEAGVTGNLGAVLLGVAGRVQDGLMYIDRCIRRFEQSRIVANPLYPGALRPFTLAGCSGIDRRSSWSSSSHGCG